MRSAGSHRLAKSSPSRRVERPGRVRFASKSDIYLKMNHATAGCLGDGICPPDCIELVDQSTNVKLGGMDRYAQPASNRLV
jgi:hypothetical protein